MGKEKQKTHQILSISFWGRSYSFWEQETQFYFVLRSFHTFLKTKLKRFPLSISFWEFHKLHSNHFEETQYSICKRLLFLRAIYFKKIMCNNENSLVKCSKLAQGLQQFFISLLQHWMSFFLLLQRLFGSFHSQS